MNIRELKTDAAIIGGSFGGVSAALSCAKMGIRSIIIEETKWIGGQATTQGVPLDEHPWIESYGRTKSYAQFRRNIRSYYKKNYPISEKGYIDDNFNPGACWVSALGYEPRVGLAVLYQMLMPYLTMGIIEIITEYKSNKVEMDGDYCKCVHFNSPQTNSKLCIHAKYFLDATELGDMLPLAKMEHVIGAESQSDTGEPLALEGEAEPLKQQGFTHLIAVDYHPEENHTIDMPQSYNIWRNRFSNMDGDNFFNKNSPNSYQACVWNFRRSFCCNNFNRSYFKSDITMLMNGNEYRDAPLVGISEAEQQKNMNDGKELSLSLLYYLQTEIKNGYNGGYGFPGIKARGDVFGTDDGLAMYPYIRESRRINAEFRVLEQNFRIDMNPDGPILFNDSIGLGGYRIDIHETAKNNKSITIDSHGKHWTQQVPLGALIPIRIKNIIPCCKNIGATHVTNGCYRLHPVEWNIGESAGYLVSYCIKNNLLPTQVRNKQDLLEEYQRLLTKQGIELQWPNYSFGRSYFSHFEHVQDWYFGEVDKL